MKLLLSDSILFFLGELGSGGSLEWLFISPVGALMCSHVEYC